MISLGLFTELRNSSDGNILLKCKLDGVTFTTNTGLAELMLVNSMLIALTQTSIRHSQLENKLAVIKLKVIKLTVIKLKFMITIDLDTFNHLIFTCINSLRFDYKSIIEKIIFFISF